MEYITDKVFAKEDFAVSPLTKAEYDSCTFSGCIFANGNLNNIVLTECVFEDCNLSMAQVKQTSFKEVKFVNCKITGVHFHDCDPFLLKIDFSGCILQLASFYKVKLKNTDFHSCDLREADFIEADLTGASFNDCDLNKAIFQDTILEKTDFRFARNYSFDPEMNRIKRPDFQKTESQDCLISIK